MYKIPLMLKVVSLYVAVFSVASAAQLLLPNPQQPKAFVPPIKVTAPPTAIAAPDIISGRPQRLLIPRLGIDLKVEDGVYNEKTDGWSLSKTNVHYALITNMPNNFTGNTLMYGHYKKGVLLNTRDIVAGDKLIVKTANGRTFTYMYTQDTVVDPDDTDFFKESASGPPRLTLLTCDGPFFEKRRLMSFVLKGVE